MNKQRQKKGGSCSLETIPTTRFEVDEGIFLNQAYSVPLTFKNHNDPTRDNSLQILSFFNKKCYIFDINRQGANLRRSIPFGVDFLTGNPEHDKFYFDPLQRLIILKKNNPADPNDQVEDDLMFEGGTKELQKIQFDNQFMNPDSTETVQGQLRLLYDQGPELLKQRLNLVNPTLLSLGKINYFSSKTPSVCFEVLTDLKDTSSYQGRTIMSLPVGEASTSIIDPTFRRLSVFVLEQGLQTKLTQSRSHLQLIGNLSNPTTIVFFDTRKKLVCKRIRVDLQEALRDLIGLFSYGILLSDGGIAYDVQNDVLLGYEPGKMFFSVAEASKGGAARHELTRYCEGEEAERTFKKVIQEANGFEQWHIHYKLKRFILEEKFGGGRTNLIQFDEGRSVVIDGTSFRLLEKEGDRYREVWSHKFKFALKPNFVKISQNVIASLSPCSRELSLHQLKDEKIQVLKAFRVLSLVETLPKSVVKGELISFEMPVKGHPSNGHFCLSYGHTIIRVDLTENLEAINTTSLPNSPYILAARDSMGEG